MSVDRAVTLCGARMEGPGHVCAFFDSRTEEYDILAPFYREGLAADEEIITVVGADRSAEHRQHLESRGIDVTKQVEDGRLHALSVDEWYMRGGEFSAGKMYTLVQEALADLQRKGRRARGAGAMDWALNRLSDTRELLEYEARVNFLIEKYDATLLCVYDINKISGRMLMDLLMTHPHIIHRRVLRKNPYYVPTMDRLREVLFPNDSQSTASSN